MTAIPSTGEATAGSDRAQARQARLAAAVAGLRRRSTGIPIDRVLLVGGSVLLPMGLIVILLGWYGAAHTSYDFEQTPYLISGGFLGAAMTIAGGFLYFGYWLTRLVQEGRRQRVELTELLGRLDGRLAVLEGVATGILPSRGATAVAATNGAAPALVTTPTGTLVHRADCPLVAGKDQLQAAAIGDGARGCKVCQPFDTAGAEPGAPLGPAAVG
jgi:hypothetical protein